MRGRRCRVAVALAAVVGLVALSGCSETGGGRRGYSSSSSSPSVDNLDQNQRRALKQGCMQRYGDKTRKYEECISGDRRSEEALIQGCYERYRGNDRKLKNCLAGLN